LPAGIYKWFTDGFDSADLKDAKVLLDQLSVENAPLAGLTFFLGDAKSSVSKRARTHRVRLFPPPPARKKRAECAGGESPHSELKMAAAT
jgi:hypothetical protein